MMPEGRITTSGTEIWHLGAAVGLLGLAFAVMMATGEELDAIIPTGWLLFSALVAVALGFIPHELAHKLVAQRYGMWAEFRAQPLWLLASLGLAIVTSFTSDDGRGLLFAAPGAVLIQGRVSARSHGVISLAGPAMNLVIAAIAWPLAQVPDIDTNHAAQLWHIVAYVNGALALFNMVPLGILDGRKVWWWHRGIYVAAMLVVLAFFVAMNMALGLPTV